MCVLDNLTELIDIMTGVKKPRYGVVTNLDELPDNIKTPNVNCYKCIHRRNVSGDCHSSCANKTCMVGCNEYAIKMGWFLFPGNYDPNWLTCCTGFEERENNESN